jgi:ABC-type glycerol-3-phosphate transport system substrate-binding protein
MSNSESRAPSAAPDISHDKARRWLLARADNLLGSREREALRAHLAGCPACRAYAAELDGLHAAVVRTLHQRWDSARTAGPRGWPDAEALAGRVRKGAVMRQTRSALGYAVALLLAVVVLAGGVLLWDRLDLAARLGGLTPAESPMPTPAGQPASGSVILAVSDADLRRYQALAEQFEQDNAGITIRVVSTDEIAANNPGESDSVRRLATAADVFPHFATLDSGEQYLLDLRPFIELDARFDPGDFMPGLLPAAPEPVLSLPTAAGYQVVYFDRAAFDAAGLPHPQPGWDMHEFLRAAQALTVRDATGTVRWGFVHNQLRYSPLLAAMLNRPLFEAGRLRLTDPDVAAGVQWVSDLFTVHQVSPWLEAYKPFDQQSQPGGQAQFALMNPGTAAMWQRTHPVYSFGAEGVGVTTIPRGPGGYAADPIVYGFAVSRGTQNAEAAYQLLRFLSHQPPQETVFPLLAPARRSVAAATGYWDSLPPALAPAVRYAAENSVSPRINRLAGERVLEAFVAHIEAGVPVAAALAQSAGAATPLPAATEVIVVPTAPAEAQGGAAAITFRTQLLVDELRVLAAEFQRQNPGIRVQVERPDTMATGLTELQRFMQADCFVAHASSLEDDALRAAVLPLGPLLELDGSLRLEDFYAIQLEPLLEGGQLYGLPAYMRAELMKYNRQFFAEAGLPEPSPDWTLDDFLAIARHFSHGEGDEQSYGYVEPLDVVFQRTGLQAFGVRVVDDNVEPPTYDFQAAAEAVAWYADLVRLYRVQPLPLSTSGFDRSADVARFEALLRGGRVAMWPAEASDIVISMRNAPLVMDIGSVPFPIGPSGSRGAAMRLPFAYFILADSPNREACWQWITFLAQHPRAVPVTLNPSLPAHIATAESEAFIAYAGADVAAAAQAFMRSPRVPDPNAGQPRWMSPGSFWLLRAYQQAAGGQASVAQGLAEAEAVFERYRQCVIERRAFDDYAEYRLCVVEVDPSLASTYPP